jgi:hypothetical protein
MPIIYSTKVLAKRFWKKVNKNGPTMPNMTTPCHVWTGNAYPFGYGRVRFGAGYKRAHHIAFFLENGRWPEPCLLHRCDNPPCVRNEHLFEGTKKDNTRDMISKGRAGFQVHPECMARGESWYQAHPPEGHARGDRNGSRVHPEQVPRGDRWRQMHPLDRHVRGDRHWSYKVTPEIRHSIITALANGKDPQESIAHRHGVDQTTVSRIKRGVSR